MAGARRAATVFAVMVACVAVVGAGYSVWPRHAASSPFCIDQNIVGTPVERTAAQAVAAFYAHWPKPHATVWRQDGSDCGALVFRAVDPTSAFEARERTLVRRAPGGGWSVVGQG